MNIKKVLIFFFTHLLLFFSIYCETQDISVLQAASELNLDIWWEPITQEVIFKKNNLEASFKINEPLILFVNHLEKNKMGNSVFSTPPYIKDGIAYIDNGFYSVLKTFFSIDEYEQNYRVGAIVIDPGHGGSDPGCVSSYIENNKRIILYEKDIALKVALSLYSMLKTGYPDKKIILTRNKDVYPTLEQRVNMANAVKIKKNESILYVSIHVNASLDSRASGYEVWYLPPDYRREVLDKKTVPAEIHTILNSMMEEEFTMESILLAQNILDGMTAKIGAQSKNRGIRANQWFVVRNVKMPSVLIELGFLTNKEEIKLLNSSTYLKKCTEGIYNGLSEFIVNFEKPEIAAKNKSEENK